MLLTFPHYLKRRPLPNAIQPADADTLQAAFNRYGPRFFGVIGLEGVSQFLTQIIGALQVRRVFKKQPRPAALALIQLFRVKAEQLHRRSGGETA